MRYRLLVTQLLLVSSVAFAWDNPVSCQLEAKSVLSHSFSGLSQVSNLGDIQITCRAPRAGIPMGETRIPLKIATVAYRVLPDGSKKLVPSETNQTGGGHDLEMESIFFHLHLPLALADRDAEASRFLAKLEQSIPPKELTEEFHQRALERLQTMVYQQRLGRFEVHCRVLDGDRVVGVAVVEIEIVFKGRFSDAGLPGFSPG